jgi:outer membrane lipoprotein carrier protein
MKKIVFFCIIFVCVCAQADSNAGDSFRRIPDVCAQAQADNLETVLSRMSAVDKQTKTLEVKFTQETLYTETNETQTTSGVLRYKKPDKIFITQTTPQEQKIYIFGKKITIYTPENAQAITDNWKNVIDEDFTPAALVNFSGSLENIKKDKELKYVNADNDNFFIELSPKDRKTWTMLLSVSKETSRVVKAVVDSGSVLISVTMSAYKIDLDLKNEVFEFKAPSGVEVIKLN